MTSLALPWLRLCFGPPRKFSAYATVCGYLFRQVFLAFQTSEFVCF